MGMALNTNGDLAMQQVNFLACGVFPEKLDAAVAQLEAEPAGVGLDPAEAYEGLSHEASAVLSAVSRVRRPVARGFRRPVRCVACRTAGARRLPFAPGVHPHAGRSLRP